MESTVETIETVATPVVTSKPTRRGKHAPERLQADKAERDGAPETVDREILPHYAQRYSEYFGTQVTPHVVTENFAAAVREADSAEDSAGMPNARAVAMLATLVETFKMPLSNKAISAILKARWTGDAGVSMFRREVFEGETVKVGKVPSHPSKSHGQRWKVCAMQTAGQPAVKGSPVVERFMVGGREYRSAVDALEAGNGLARVAAAIRNVAKPPILDLGTLPAGSTIPGRQAAGAAKASAITVKVRSVDDSGMSAKNVKLSDDVEATVGFCIAALMAVSGLLTADHKDAIIDAMEHRAVTPDAESA
jgi:hypothetical protein